MRPTTGRWLLVVAIALLVLGGIVTGPWANESRHLVLLHTNDLHGQCHPLPAPWIDRGNPPLAGGLLRLAERIEAERRSEPGALLVDAGDWFRGTPEGAIEGGLSYARILAKLGFDAVCVGNHELDHGLDHLVRMLSETGLPAVLANVRDPATGQGVRGTKPWRVIERGGLRIAFVGLLTTVTPDITHADARRLEFEDPVAAWDRACRELEGLADLIVPLTHLPVDEARALARARPRIPLIVSAHDHARLEHGVREGNTLIVQNGAKGLSLGRVDLWLATGSKRVVRSEARLIDLVDDPGTAVATPVAAACQELVARTSERMDQVVGTLATPCERGKHRLSSPQGNWICDALLRASGAQVAIQNKGGTRADLAAGLITRRHLFDLLPFDNTIVSMSLGGAALEAIVKRGIEDTRHRGIDVGGMKVHVRRMPDDALSLDHVEIDGKPLERERHYRVVTSSYLGSGEAGYVEFLTGKERREMPILMRELMEEDVRRAGEVRPSPEARIIVLSGESTQKPLQSDPGSSGGPAGTVKPRRRRAMAHRRPWACRGGSPGVQPRRRTVDTRV